jgi:hypothetical protein
VGVYTCILGGWVGGGFLLFLFLCLFHFVPFIRRCQLSGIHISH